MNALERKTDDMASMALFLFFFCDKVFASLIYRFVGSDLLAVAYNCIFFALVLLSCLSARAKRLIPCLVFYALVFALIGGTVVSHPEYNEWFFGDRYGISAMFLNPRGAIWAFLVVSLVGDRKRLFQCLKIAAWLILAYQAIRYLTASAQGYWEELDYLGNTVEQAYSLTFGYETLFPVAVFGACAFLERKRYCYIPFAIGFALIFLGGSRGAFVFVPALFLIMTPFRWVEMSIQGRIALVGCSLVAIAAFSSDILTTAILDGLKASGIESRTLESIINGTVNDSDGRDAIYQMALGLIRDGGAFGHGVYGDRTTVGTLNIWGYSHNIFLELYVSFGYLGGTLVCAVLLGGVIWTYCRCKTVYDKVLFSVFLGCSLKLLLSDSFWYYQQFWALVALMTMWKAQRVEKAVQKTSEMLDPAKKRAVLNSSETALGR